MWFSMDLNVFFFFLPIVITREGKILIAENVWFSSLLWGEKKKTRKWKVNSHEVPRKTIIGPSGRTEGRNGPMGNKQALTGLRAALCGWTLVPVRTGNGHPNVCPWPFKVGFQGAVKRQQVDSPSSTCFTQGTGAWWALGGA